MNDTLLSRLNTIKAKWVFLALWVLTFVLYIATTRGGWVIDGVGFLYNMKHQAFGDFINRTNSQDQSFYQMLTLHYYIFYKIWGLNPVLWGILYITTHAINALLLFILARNILADSGIAKSTIIPLCGVLIYTISPQISEILVCRAYYHYLLCFMFILFTLLAVQKYQHDQKGKHALIAALLFFLSTFTLEIFYIVPVLVMVLALYYRLALNYDKKILRKTFLYFFLPQVLLMGVYFIVLLSVFKQFHPHKIALNLSVADYLSKLPKYLFHIVFFGRYFSLEAKKAVYAACESLPVLIICYGLLVFALIFFIYRIKRITAFTKANFLFLIFTVVLLGFLMPLPFPGPELLVFYDRYTYFADPFIYILLAMLAAAVFSNKYLLIGLFCIYIDVSLFFTIKVNTYWMESDVINNSLIRHFPDPGNRTVLLLNIPENMAGAPMIGAQPEGMYKMMREVYTDTLIKNTVYDVASYNMNNDYDGANVRVLNDSVIKVKLNHTGNWWWYEGHGAKSYETPDYSVKMKDPGSWYEITLKHPASQYMLLYSVGDKWKEADMSKKNVQQD